MSFGGKRFILSLTLLCPIAAFGGTFAYAWYLRSEANHRRIEADVSTWMGMPVTFGALEPLSFHGQAFRDVAARLWDGGPHVFACDRATWVEQLVGDEPGYHLHLRSGWLVVGTPEWRRYEYERLIAAGLQHDFAELGLRRVRLEDFNFRWVQDDFEVRAESATGVIDFTESGEGEARLKCRALNGREVGSPISITARFTSGAALDFHDVELSIPRMALDAAGLEQVLGGAAKSGEVSGRLRFAPEEGVAVWTFVGELLGAELAELTRRVPGGPFDGRAHLEVDRFEVADRKVRAVECAGEIAAMRPGQIWPVLDPQETSRLHLNVRRLNVAGESIRHLSASGYLSGLSLEPISELVGRGKATGVAEIVITSIIINDDRVEYADLEINVHPPPEGPGYLDREMLASAAKELLGVDVSSMLPERVEYARFGARLQLQGDQLRIFGTHGYENQTLLTVRLFDREVGLVRQPDRTFTVPEPLAWLKARGQRYDVEDVRTWWLHGRFTAPARRSPESESVPQP